MYTFPLTENIVEDKACSRAENPSIEGLPTEILIHIFDLCNVMKTEIMGDQNISSMWLLQRRTLLAITHTCSRWRKIALSTPFLWTHIQLIPRQPLLEHALRSVILSKNLPLVIYFKPSLGDHESPGLSFTLPGFLTAELCTRIRKLVIHTEQLPNSYLERGTTFGDAPILEQLDIIRSPGEESLEGPTVDFAFKYAPLLKRVRLGVWSPALVASHFAGLRTLDVGPQDLERRDPNGIFPRLLQAAPRQQLEELIIRDRIPHSIFAATSDYGFGPTHPLEFPRLRKLVLSRVRNNVSLAVLLSSIRVPDTTTREYGLMTLTRGQRPLLSLSELASCGKLVTTCPLSHVRKLQMVSLPQEEHEDSQNSPTVCFAVDGEVATITYGRTAQTDNAPCIQPSRSFLAHVEELTVLSLNPYARFMQEASNLFPALPSLRKLTVSGTSRFVMRDIQAMMEHWDNDGGSSSRSPLCPTLEEVQLLYYNPGRQTLCFDDVSTGKQDPRECQCLLEIAEDRRRQGRALKAVVVEGFPEANMKDLRNVVGYGRVANVKRWVDCPTGYFEDDIIQAIEAFRGLSS